MDKPMNEYAADAPRVLRDFLTYISTIRGKSAKTAHEYYLDLRLFFRVLKHNKGAVDKNLPLDEIDISDIDLDFIRDITLSDTYDYLEYMAQSRPTQQNSNHTNYGLSVNSRARKVSAIRAFFRYLTDKQHVLEVNPVSGLEAPTVRKSLPTYLTTDDSVRLLESVTGPYAERDYCILTFFLNCGMRVSELVGLNLTDFKDDTVRVLGKGCARAVSAQTPGAERARRGRAVCQQKAQPHQCADGQVAGKEIYRSSRTRSPKILCAQAASHSGNAHVPERRGYSYTAKHSWSLECGYDHDLHPHRE